MTSSSATIEPQKTQRATLIRRVASRSGMLPAAFVIWRTLREWTPSLVLRNRRLRKKHESGIPVPPGNLLFSATGSRDVNWFLSSGESTASAFREALTSIDRPIESFGKIFELGSGCGRVLRQWADVKGPRFFASDYNPRGIEWGRSNLPFVSFAVNKLEPPLPFDDAQFDLCYAVSVFTHLPEHLQEPWLREMRRVTRPGGMLIVTLSGEGDLVRVTPEEQRRFFAGELVVVDEKFAGTNMCGVYHPESYVRTHWSPYFRLLRFIPEGAKGSPKQDLYVFERTA